MLSNYTTSTCYSFFFKPQGFATAKEIPNGISVGLRRTQRYPITLRVRVFKFCAFLKKQLYFTIFHFLFASVYAIILLN